MSKSLNKVQIIGNLGRDPEVRALPNGQKVVNLRVATSESWKDKSTDEWRERTEWHSVTIYNEHFARDAEANAKKGSKVYVEGQLQTRKWTDQQGQDRYTTEIVLQQFRGDLIIYNGPRAPQSEGQADDDGFGPAPGAADDGFGPAPDGFEPPY